MQPARLIKINVYTISAGDGEALCSPETILDALLQNYAMLSLEAYLYFYRFLTIAGKGLESYC